MTKNSLRFVPPIVVQGKAVGHIDRVNLRCVQEIVYMSRKLKQTWKLRQILPWVRMVNRWFLFNPTLRKRDMLYWKWMLPHFKSIGVRPWQLFVEAEMEEMKTIPIWETLRSWKKQSA